MLLYTPLFVAARSVVVAAALTRMAFTCVLAGRPLFTGNQVPGIGVGPGVPAGVGVGATVGVAVGMAVGVAVGTGVGVGVALAANEALRLSDPPAPVPPT